MKKFNYNQENLLLLPCSNPNGMADEGIDQYKQELLTLTFNSKPIINTLTMIAGESLTMAPLIVDAIADRVVTVSSHFLILLFDFIVIFEFCQISWGPLEFLAQVTSAGITQYTKI